MTYDVDLDAEWDIEPTTEKNATTRRYAYYLDRSHPFGHVQGPFAESTWRVFVNLGVLGVKHSVDVITDLEGAKQVMESMVAKRLIDLGLR